ncbi:MAG: hypothetical protein LUH05_08505 [Candidatus Gastranaerophilales bacterium]|nr:hypothetical protein [Candidatus Gastranaerophilales bacterium]
MHESNNDFFSYNGTISRKNYLINMLILIALYVGCSFIRFENFEPFIPVKFLFSVLLFMVGLFKFVILMSALSVIYRRIADFSRSKSYNFIINMKRIFVFIFIFPVLYLFCLRYFFDIIPFIINILDTFVISVLIPLAFIASIIFCFIKGK